MQFTSFYHANRCFTAGLRLQRQVDRLSWSLTRDITQQIGGEGILGISSEHVAEYIQCNPFESSLMALPKKRQPALPTV